mmetsp:Transcript_31674/g.66157  ORF Transcript_31674/g.66157 Transcript_31674/m.66157 type:complete len:246 (+) Transcript_31674:961-1698(+)
MFPGDYVEGEHFSVFVKRTINNTTLGWEYCGEYNVMPDDFHGINAADCVPRATKETILADAKASLIRPNGCWQRGIKRWKKTIQDLLKKDDSPAGPTRLKRLSVVEKFKYWDDVDPNPQDEGKERQDREESESKESASSAAKARALGMDDEELSEFDIAKRLVHFDDYYETQSIYFVRYDEDMYNFCKDEKTKKNKHNKRRKPDEPCAKARDWYAIYDQNLTENDRDSKRRKKISRGPTIYYHNV